MGSFLVGDVVTGRTIPEDDEVVALVVAVREPLDIDDRVGGATIAIRSTDMFEVVSLPIRGRMGDCGEVMPYADQPSVAYLLATYGLKDWEAFRGTALDTRGPGVPGLDALNRPVGPRSLALATVTAATWARLTSSGEGPGRARDVAAVLGLLTEEIAATAPAFGDGSYPSDRAGRKVWSHVHDVIGRLATLRCDPTYERFDGEEVGVPDLARCLGVSEGAPFGAVLRNWLTQRSGMLGIGEGVGKPPVGLLESLWEADTALSRMTELGVLLRPAVAGCGVETNDRAVAEMAVGTLAETLRALLDDEYGYDEAAAVLERLDAMRAALVAKVEEARDAVMGPSGP